jgi:hypothetical protein
MLYDETARKILARDRVADLRRDFGRPGLSVRAAIGRVLVAAGMRLGAAPPTLSPPPVQAYPAVRLRSSACQYACHSADTSSSVRPAA